MIPTNTRALVAIKTALSKDVQAIAVFIATGGIVCGDAPHLLDDATNAALKKLLAAKSIHGKAGQSAAHLLESNRRLLLIGVGAPRDLDNEAVRAAAGTLASVARTNQLSRLAVVPPVLTEGGLSGAEALVTGFLLASFEYREQKGAGRETEEEPEVTLTVLSTPASMKQLQPLVQRAKIIADAQNFARTIAHRPGNVINPPALAKVAQDMAREAGLTCKILDEKQLAKLGMGGILAVGGGSTYAPPRIIILEHRGGPKSQKPLLAVGKAITFDTGGISIKPADKMGKMIFDKCGAMAVLGFMLAAAKLKLRINLVGILSSAENHVSETAYRPGDILKMYNGVTVEVTNTDAEGRLVLGDALAWGIETYLPSAVVDLATLTGGVVVALGKTMAGVMSNNDQLFKELDGLTRITGEKMWRLPLGKQQREQIHSDDADIVNSAGRDAHPLQGGAFLSYFVPDDGSVPWAHIDIAGVSDSDKDSAYYHRGATGWGVRTLVEWAAARITR